MKRASGTVGLEIASGVGAAVCVVLMYFVPGPLSAQVFLLVFALTWLILAGLMMNGRLTRQEVIYCTSLILDRLDRQSVERIAEYGAIMRRLESFGEQAERQLSEMGLGLGSMIEAYDTRAARHHTETLERVASLGDAVTQEMMAINGGQATLRAAINEIVSTSRHRPLPPLRSPWEPATSGPIVQHAQEADRGKGETDNWSGKVLPDPDNGVGLIS